MCPCPCLQLQIKHCNQTNVCSHCSAHRHTLHRYSMKCFGLLYLDIYLNNKIVFWNLRSIKMTFCYHWIQSKLILKLTIPALHWAKFLKFSKYEYVLETKKAISQCSKTWLLLCHEDGSSHPRNVTCHVSPTCHLPVIWVWCRGATSPGPWSRETGHTQAALCHPPSIDTLQLD